MKKIFFAIRLFLNDRFNLGQDQNDNIETIKSIEKAVEFRGINLWTLVFAIFVASIGLNVNSTAVVIGAMLISPLMGPIMGLGLSVGINDFVLLKKSLKNMAIAVVISVLTSAIYFLISPLNEARSELLARTMPTIYDVLIAFFGGLAGIVAGASKEKGNAIPGVAIATALMPPLCTAGFGIATGNLMYFLGAFYLFFINAVMISVSTFLIVRFLKFPLKELVDEERTRSVKKYISIIVAITVMPSIYFGYRIIEQTIFDSEVVDFFSEEFNYEKTQIINKTTTFNQFDSCEVQIFLAGEYIDENEITELQNRLDNYTTKRTKLIVKQGIEEAKEIDINQIKSGIIEEIYYKNELAIKDKDKKIKLLEDEIFEMKNAIIPQDEIGDEIFALNPKITKFSAFKSVIHEIDEDITDSIIPQKDTAIIVYLSVTRKLTKTEKNTLTDWLKERLDYENVKIISE